MAEYKFDAEAGLVTKNEKSNCPDHITIVLPKRMVLRAIADFAHGLDTHDDQDGGLELQLRGELSRLSDEMTKGETDVVYTLCLAKGEAEGEG